MPTRIANIVIFPRGSLNNNNNKACVPTISPPFCPVSPSSSRFPLPSRPAPSPPATPPRQASLPATPFPSLCHSPSISYSSSSHYSSPSTPILRNPQLRRVDSAPALILVINPAGRSSSLPQNRRLSPNKIKKSLLTSRNISTVSLPQLSRRPTRMLTFRPRPSASTPATPKVSLSSSSWHERLYKPFLPCKPHIPSTKSCKHRLQRCLCPFCGTSVSAHYCVICQDVICVQCGNNKSKSQNCLVQEFSPLPEIDRYHSIEDAAAKKLSHYSTYSENELIQNWIDSEEMACSHEMTQAHQCFWCTKPNANYCILCQFIWCKSCGGKFGSETNKINQEIGVQKNGRSKVSKVWKGMIKGVRECMI